MPPPAKRPRQQHEDYDTEFGDGTDLFQFIGQYRKQPVILIPLQSGAEWIIKTPRKTSGP